MSIVIDPEDDDLVIVDNSVQSVFADDSQLIECIEKDLESKTDLISNCYRDIYNHYNEAVLKLLADKDELNTEILHAPDQRLQILKREFFFDNSKAPKTRNFPIIFMF